MSSGDRHSLRQIYSWPLALAAVTIAALLLGLLGTGVLDAIAVLGLAAAPCLCLYKLVRAFR